MQKMNCLITKPTYTVDKEVNHQVDALDHMCAQAHYMHCAVQVSTISCLSMGDDMQLLCQLRMLLPAEWWIVCWSFDDIYFVVRKMALVNSFQYNIMILPYNLFVIKSKGEWSASNFDKFAWICIYVT